ncbi:DUF3021 domain-containing protein [Hominifimenecus sp. rT4P-3]|uniref:DUF3021 domain-containing protein n=1 Tax=Hominifimenecus sp. rT4P-3 TaxID=3242979 RepID=UPI003DA2FBEF
MKKKLILRGILGFPLGITIGYCITILISLVWADGYYSPCVPELISVMGNEIYAVLFQALLSGLLGAGFGASSVIWEIESWSIVKQTGIYFGIVSVIMMPVAYFTYWMEHSMAGFLSYFGIFVLIFVMIWILQFVWGKQMVKKMNANLYKVKNDE